MSKGYRLALLLFQLYPSNLLLIDSLSSIRESSTNGRLNHLVEFVGEIKVLQVTLVLFQIIVSTNRNVWRSSRDIIP